MITLLSHKVGSLLRVPLLFLVFCLLNCCSCTTVRKPVSAQEYKRAFSETPHEVKLLVRGQEALRERLRLIRSANSSIELQTFVWADDECGQLIFLELAKAAGRGVQVRLLCDYLYVANDPDILAAASRVPRLQMRLYNPVASSARPRRLDLLGRGLFSTASLNQRMHNKLMVVDGTAAICGGRNIDNQYFHESTERNFKDLEIIIRGKVVADMKASFEAFWNSSLAKDVRTFEDVEKSIADETYQKKNIRKIEGAELYRRMAQALEDPEVATADQKGYVVVRKIAFFGDEPGKNQQLSTFNGSSRLNETLIHSVMAAESNIWIQTPYLVLSQRAKKVFKQVRERKPALDIRISSNSMAATDKWAAFSYLYKNQRLLVDELGVRLYQFKPLPADLEDYFPNYNDVLQRRTGESSMTEDMMEDVAVEDYPFLCIHAKCMQIDDRLSFIGSYNLDPRSANLNTELSVAIDDPAFALTLRRYLEKDFQPRNSWPVWRRKNTRLKQLVVKPVAAINSVVRHFTTLDLWPSQTVCCYEQRKGCDPVPVGHPEFLTNYEAVGNFPRLSPLNRRKMLAQMLKATGRFLRPVM